MPNQGKARRMMLLMLAWLGMITVGLVIAEIRDEQRTDQAIERTEGVVAQLEGPGAQARVDADILVLFLNCQLHNRQNLPLLDIIENHPGTPIGPVAPQFADCVKEALAIPGVDREDVLRVIREENLRFPNFGDPDG